MEYLNNCFSFRNIVVNPCTHHAHGVWEGFRGKGCDMIKPPKMQSWNIGKGRIKTSTAAHAGGHTQSVYGSRDDSVCNTFTKCEKIELMNTFTQNTNLNLHQTSPNT